MEIINTKDMDEVASFNAIVYGMGGVGKTTFVSTFPKPLLLDFENGAKYFKQRGIELDTIQFTNWPTESDKKQLAEVIGDYETIAVDPIGTAMQLLIDDKVSISGSKYRQQNGDLTMAGWGEAKKQMRSFVQFLLRSGKNVILNAHISEDKDDQSGVIIRRPLIATGLKEELLTMVDVVAYFGNRTRKDDETGEEEIIRYLDMRTGQNHISKDRTGKLNASELKGFIKPEWSFIKELLKDKTTKIEKKSTKKKSTTKKVKVADEKEVIKSNPFNKKK